MAWSSRKSLHPIPKCWSCHHYQYRETGEDGGEHRCHIEEPGFPTIGRNCAAYIYEPGTDIAELET